MLSNQEKKIFFWLASNWLRDTGAIVDLGCFAGGSTAFLAEGQRVAGHSANIYAYDQFTVDEKRKKKRLYPAGVASFEGSDLLPVAKEVLSPWSERVTLRPGRIERSRWVDGPIELLVVDASKTDELSDQIAEIFFPSLIAGESIILQQDLLHWKQPWLSAQMYMLREFFKPIAFCPNGLVAYLCIQTPSLPDIRNGAVARLTDDRLIELIEMAQQSHSSLGKNDLFIRLQRSVKANPGARAFWKFPNPPA